MKIRGSIAKVITSAGVALVASFLLVAGFRSSQNLFHGSGANKPQVASTGASSASHSNDAKILEAYGKLPLSFIENQGQTVQEVRYVSHGAQYDLFLTPQEAIVALRQTKHFDMSPRHRAQSLKAMREARKAASTTTALRMQFEGANPHAQVTGAENLPGKVNYYIGNDPKKWRTGIPTYARVKYTQVYPGVDLVFYGNQRRLEYDFVVAPGADPNVIQMNLEGAHNLRLDLQGNVMVGVPGGEVELQKPVVYQNINGTRHEIAGRYTLRGQHIAFTVAQYDRREPLVLDPVLNYATYLGGSGDDEGFAIAVDAGGDAFVAGMTFSTNFVTNNGLSAVGSATGMGFVTELNATGTAEVYSTYLGGTTGGDGAFGVAVAGGDIYVTGLTVSNDFPTTTNALKTSISAIASGTSFFTKLNPTASGAASLVYSTYLGGNNGDFGNAVAADSTGNAYVVGATFSAAGNTDILFPVVNGSQTTLPNSNGSAFLSRIDTTKSGTASLIYSTYLGGDDAYFAAATFADQAFGVAVDAANKAYIAGVTASSNFPVSAVTFQAAPKAANVISSVFLSEIDTTLSGAGSLVYSTYLGGDGNGTLGDFGNAVDLQSGTTVAYVTGTTNSANYWTTTGAYQTTGDSVNGSGFVTLLDTAVKTSLKYSTFLGVGGTTGSAIKADTVSGNAFVAGATGSSTFPVTAGAYQTSPAAGATGDGFVTEIHPGGGGLADLIYSTYFGGSGGPAPTKSPDQIFGLALGTTPTVFVTGQTFSTNLPSTTGVFQPALDGTSDAFIASLNLAGVSLTLSATTLSFNSTAVGTPTAAQTVTLTNNTNSAIAFTSATVTAGNPAAADTDFMPTTACTSIPAFGTCNVSVVYTPSVAAMETATLTLTDAVGVQTVAMTGTVNAVPPSFTVTAPSTLTVAKGKNGTATITVGSVGGFTAAVALTCTGEPAKSTCTIAPSSVSPAAGGSATATLTLATTSLVAPPPASPRFPPVSIRVVVPVFAALLMLLLFLSEQRFRTRVGLAGALLVFVALSGCGSSGTAKGTSTLTVTGTSGGVSQTATITLTVD